MSAILIGGVCNGRKNQFFIIFFETPGTIEFLSLSGLSRFTSHMNANFPHNFSDPTKPRPFLENEFPRIPRFNKKKIKEISENFRNMEP